MVRYANNFDMSVSNMEILSVVIFSLIEAIACYHKQDFPPGFKFGAASSAYQVEGGWNASDKTESIWDVLVHGKPHAISDGSTGDVACDSYHLWRRDIEMCSELGLHFYRFSLSWPRLAPNGFMTEISKDGLKFYNNLIDGLLENGIQPMVTLYHWDLPQKLQDLGGWANPLIADWFGDYARVVFSLFGDRVKTWITINEPIIICDMSYNTGMLAPGIVDDVATYLCSKNVLMAHAKAWRIYDEEFKPKYHGGVALANQLLWLEPVSPEDEELTEIAREHAGGRYSHPIYSKEGGWPPVVEKVIAKYSKKNGYPKSTLPKFTKKESEFIKGTFDFYAFNHYTSRLVRRAKDGEVTTFPLEGMPEVGAKFEPHPDWKPTTATFFYVYPEGLRRQLLWLKKKYGDIKFIITENGFASNSGLDDTDRIDNYASYLKQVILSIKEDGVNITGYTAWTLMDNFEWMDGYSTKMGLYQVDFSSPEKTRTRKASAHFYKNIIQQHSLDSIVYDEL